MACPLGKYTLETSYVYPIKVYGKIITESITKFSSSFEVLYFSNKFYPSNEIERLEGCSKILDPFYN
jgi:hypothetical protein